MTTARYKGYIIEVDHDAVWGFQFDVIAPDGEAWDSEQCFSIEQSSSWTTEKECFDAAADTINQEINRTEYEALTKS